MKEIFKKLEGRDWDWFGGKPMAIIETLEVKHYRYSINIHCEWYSLADLLANDSWNQALGLSQPQTLVAFVTLKNEGEEACIKYIKETMIK